MSTESPDLATSEHWDDRWSELELPLAVRRGQKYSLDKTIDVLDEYLPRGEGLEFLEIGGAPGQWLSYIAQARPYRINLLDYSKVGLEFARKNLDALGVPATLHYGDMLDHELGIGQFDVVMSLGVIEHFENLNDAVAAHLRLVRPGGTVILGMPNFAGVNKAFKRLLSPEDLALHNLSSMDFAAWDVFEREFGLERVHRGYVGGFEARFLRQVERPNPWRWVLWFLLSATAVLTDLPGLNLIHSVNGPSFSAYLIGVYRAPGAPASG